MVLIWGLFICLSTSLYAQELEHITTKIDYETKVIQGPQSMTILVFTESLCPLCATVVNSLTKLVPEYPDIACYIIDKDTPALRAIIDQYGITETPTIIYREVGIKNRGELNRRIKSFSTSDAPDKNESRKKRNLLKRDEQ